MSKRKQTTLLGFFSKRRANTEYTDSDITVNADEDIEQPQEPDHSLEASPESDSNKQTTAAVSRPTQTHATTSRTPALIEPNIENPCISTKSFHASYVPKDFTLGTKHTGPVQVVQAAYPYRNTGKNKRSFQAAWFKLFPWLEYDVTHDSTFCFACRIFTADDRSKSDKAFTLTGFSNWKKALHKFKEHSQCNTHVEGMTKWTGFLSTLETGTISQEINKGEFAQIRARREYVKRLFETVILLAKQGIAFRGHDEGDESDNKGNFVEVLQYLEKRDPFFQEFVIPQNMHYCSPRSQNEMIECAANCTRAKIIRSLNAAGYYAIMADDSRDITCREQMSICLRYVHNNEPHESFVGFEHVSELDATSLNKTICSTLEKIGVHATCVAQSYDGASVMSGHLNGVQEKFRSTEGNEMAIYTHCYAHKLNLVLVSTCQALPEASSFFTLLQGIHSYFSVSTVHHEGFIALQTQMGLKSKKIDALSTTRWSSHIRAVRALKATYKAVVKYFENSTHGDVAKAKGLLVMLHNFSHVMCMFIFEKLLELAFGTHNLLQKGNLDLLMAVDGVQALKSTLQEYRDDETLFEELYNDAVEFTKSVDASVQEEPIQKRIRRRPRVLDDYFEVDDVVGLTTASSVRDGPAGETRLQHYRKNVYLPILDQMIHELARRFSTENIAIISSIQAFQPISTNFLNSTTIEPFINHYHLEHPKEELTVARNFIKAKQLKSPNPVLKVLQDTNSSTLSELLNVLPPEMFPRLCKALRVALTIPVTSCSCERSFSVMKRLLSYIRSTMGQERLTSLAMLQVEKHVLLSIDVNEMIDCFAEMGKRRSKLILPTATRND